MSASLLEIVERGRTIADGRGVDPIKNPVIDNGMTAEALVPHAIRMAVHGATAEDLTAMATDHAITMIEDDTDIGVGDLPAGVIRKFLDQAYLPDYPHSSYIPYPDFKRSLYSNLLSYFTFRNNKIYVTGDEDMLFSELILNAVAVPIITNATDDLGLPDNITEAAILIIAGALTGEIPIKEILEVQL